MVDTPEVDLPDEVDARAQLHLSMLWSTLCKLPNHNAPVSSDMFSKYPPMVQVNRIQTISMEHTVTCDIKIEKLLRKAQRPLCDLVCRFSESCVGRRMSVLHHLCLFSLQNQNQRQ